MDNDQFPKLDRTVYSFVSLEAQDDEVEYWKTKTPQERWDALELMRQMIYGYDPLTTRLQRVFEFAERPPS